jgi:hypothetical protein
VTNEEVKVLFLVGHLSGIQRRKLKHEVIRSINKLHQNMKNNVNKVFARFYRVSAKSNLELSPELSEVIIGLMLGDLYAEKKNLNSNTRLQFKQSNKNKDYIDHLYNLFKLGGPCGPEHLPRAGWAAAPP